MANALTRHLPIAGWLPHYDRSWLRADLLAGVALWALVVPQAMAYAQIAGLPPHVGIFVMITAPLVYALLGTSRQLVCGPSSSTAAISAAHVASLAAGGLAGYATLSVGLAVLSGLLLLLLGALKLGFVAQFIADSVQTGFLFGLGITIIVGQAFKLTGLDDPGGPLARQVPALLGHLGDANRPTLALGVGSVMLLVLLKRVLPRVPAALVVVALGIAVVARFGLDRQGVAVVGEVMPGLPRPTVPRLTPDLLFDLLPAALAIVVVSYSESTTIARRYAREHGYEIDPTQELYALGASGIVSGLFQGFVTSGGASQSAAADRDGMRSQVASLVLSGLAVLTALVLLPVIRTLPLAVLGAIVVDAVSGFLNVGEMRRMWRLGGSSVWLALLALAGVLSLGVVRGLLLAVAVSLVLLLAGISRPPLDIVARTLGHDGDLLLVRPTAPLLFVNATSLRDNLRAALATGARPAVVAVDLTGTVSLDSTGLDAITRLRSELATQGTALWLTGVRPGVREAIDRSGQNPTDGAPWLFAADQASSAFAARKPPAPTP